VDPIKTKEKTLWTIIPLRPRPLTSFLSQSMGIRDRGNIIENAQTVFCCRLNWLQSPPPPSYHSRYIHFSWLSLSFPSLRVNILERPRLFVLQSKFFGSNPPYRCRSFHLSYLTLSFFFCKLNAVDGEGGGAMSNNRILKGGFPFMFAFILFPLF
jgi:hypothetical protein